jgi:hypothetical protein
MAARTAGGDWRQTSAGNDDVEGAQRRVAQGCVVRAPPSPPPRQSTGSYEAGSTRGTRRRFRYRSVTETARLDQMIDDAGISFHDL